MKFFTVKNLNKWALCLFALCGVFYVEGNVYAFEQNDASGQQGKIINQTGASLFVVSYAGGMNSTDAPKMVPQENPVLGSAYVEEIPSGATYYAVDPASIYGNPPYTADKTNGDNWDFDNPNALFTSFQDALNFVNNGAPPPYLAKVEFTFCNNQGCNVVVGDNTIDFNFQFGPYMSRMDNNGNETELTIEECPMSNSSCNFQPSPSISGYNFNLTLLPLGNSFTVQK